MLFCLMHLMSLFLYLTLDCSDQWLDKILILHTIDKLLRPWYILWVITVFNILHFCRNFNVYFYVVLFVNILYYFSFLLIWDKLGVIIVCNLYFWNNNWFIGMSIIWILLIVIFIVFNLVLSYSLVNVSTLNTSMMLINCFHWFMESERCIILLNHSVDVCFSLFKILKCFHSYFIWSHLIISCKSCWRWLWPLWCYRTLLSHFI